MKKLFSILFAAAILLSGMHLSMDTHICGGEIAQVKWSFSHEKGSCGMEMPGILNTSGKNILPESCCKDEISIYAVDNNYQPSSLQVDQPVFHLLQEFYIPENIGSLSVATTTNSHNTNIQPPGHSIASAVKLPDICVFLI